MCHQEFVAKYGDFPKFLVTLEIHCNTKQMAFPIEECLILKKTEIVRP